MWKEILIIVVFCVGGFLSSETNAQDFVYKPINSSFGGDQYNYNWLLNSATQQNKILDPTDESLIDADPLDSFKDDLNRQILSQLSSRLVSSIFGDSGSVETGSYNLGNYKVDITEDGSGVSVNIQDITTGNFTNVLIPNY